MRIMYLGPELKGVVRHNQIFSYNPEDVIEKACQRNPLAKHLFVDMEDIVAKKKELHTEGSLLNLTFRKILKQEVDHGRL
ncbi:MAG: hypothetical protein E7276_06980 [Pseudobutyrivibrio sp.]|nr:hypothetical protein [Pseudobutyrivibrio sp.]